MRKLSRFLLGLILLATLPAVSAHELFDELQKLPELQNSRVIDTQHSVHVEKIYPLGSIRRISGRLRYTGQVLLSGEKFNLTMRLARTHEADEGFAAVREHLQNQGAQMLFWCAARDCGASNLWANSIFNNARLYGPDERQSYAVFKDAHSSGLIVMYAITRGNGRPMLHVEQILAEQMPADLRPTADTLLRQLQEGGKLKLGFLPAQPESSWVDLLAGALKRGSASRVVIGGENAALWYEQLVTHGVKGNRLELDASQESALYLQLIQ